MPTAMRIEPRDGAIDDFDGGRVAVLGSGSPREESMRLEHHATRMRMRVGKLLQLQCQLEARSDPRQPADLIAIHLLRQGAAVGRGGYPDDRVRMHVIDVR